MERETGVSYATIGRILRGEMCDVQTLIQLSTWLRLPMGYLLGQPIELSAVETAMDRLAENSMYRGTEDVEQVDKGDADDDDR